MRVKEQMRVAIVTGASSGIGLEMLLALLKAGYCVVGTSRTISKAADLKKLSNLTIVDGDAGKKETAVAVNKAAIENYGRIDLLVNNAGIFLPKPFTEYTENDFELMISTNVASFFFMTQQVVSQMQKQKEGHVISISTTLVDQPIRGIPAGLPVLTKSTLAATSKQLAIEYAPYNIRFNTISPGTVRTPMHADENPEELSKLSPLGRIAEISEIVDAMFFLQDAKFISGENLHVDGGAHAGRW
jgi:NAD(P)-dependent dehydrogenase (short-subunit alcohol dehydrogenase family)